MSPAAARPRIALVGCGNWGKNHLRTWTELGCLAVACDVSIDRLATVPEGIERSTSPEECVEREDIDGVVIATPAPTHAALALRALRAGKDVLVEKPLAVKMSDAQPLVDEARHRGAILMVGHVLEYHPAFLKLRELVEAGDLGRVLYLYSHRLNFGMVRTEENAMWSFAPHDLALLLRLVGTEPDEVSCHGGAYISSGVADATVMNLTFPDGVRAHIFVSWLHPFKEHRFIVVGDRQMAVFDDTAGWDEKLALYRHQLDWRDGRIPVARRAEAEFVPLQPVEPLRAECEHFLARMSDRGPALTDGASGVAVLRLLDAGERSLQLGGPPISVREQRDSADPSVVVHRTATVDHGAVIGANTRIWHYAHVMAGAVIGASCVLGQNVFVGDKVRIGDRVKIQNNVSLYEGVELEGDVFCGPSMVFTNVINPRANIERKDEFRRTVVRQGATLGANSTVVCGVTIGRHALVGAGAVVTRDIPDYALALGMPARIVGWVCECGVGLGFADKTAVCAACGRRYQLVDADHIEPL